MRHNTPVPMPSQEHLRECFDYDPATGEMTWKRRPLHHFKNEHGMNTFNAKYAGMGCGHRTPRGYLTLHMNGQAYLAHRLIWKWVTGREPTHEIDHRNEDKSCNRWDNLREASHLQNTVNRGPTLRNSTGLKGVSWDSSRNCFAAYIRLGGKSTFLGRFATKEAAGAAYQRAARAAHGEFAKTISEGVPA